MLELTAAHGDACRMHGGRPCTQSTLNLLHLKAGGDAGGFAEHDAGRAVFFMAHRDGALHRSGGNRFSGDREVHIDGGKHLRVDRRALRGELDRAAADRVAAALEDKHHVVGSTATGTRQQ